VTVTIRARRRVRIGLRRRRGAALLALALVSASVALSACGASSGTTITLYNGQHVQTTDALVVAFEKAHPNIHVQVRSDDENTLDAQIVQEGPRSPADVIYTENSPALEYLQRRGLLTALPHDVLTQTPARYDSPSGRWVGVSARASVIVYNPSVLSAARLPTGVLQLAESRYRGLIALAPSETDFQPIVTAVLRHVGRARTIAWLEGLKANAEGHIYPSNEALTLAVNRGAVGLAVINQYYWYRLGAAIGTSAIHSKLAYFAPRDPGYVVDVSGIGVLRSSSHRGAAEAFVRFVVSRAGQEVIAHSDSFEYPIAAGVTTSQPERSLADLRPDPISIAELGTGSTAVALLREVQLL
jgi:iron(III) transport system substrate-binding protein